MARKLLALVLTLTLVLSLVVVSTNAFAIPNVGGYISTGTFPNDRYLDTIPYNSQAYTIEVTPGESYNVVIPVYNVAGSGSIEVFGSFEYTAKSSYNVTNFDGVYQVTNTPLNGTGAKKSFPSVTTNDRITGLVITIDNIGDPLFTWLATFTNATYPKIVDGMMLPYNTTINFECYGYVFGDMEDDVMNALVLKRDAAGVQISATCENGTIWLCRNSTWVANVSITFDDYNATETYLVNVEEFFKANMLMTSGADYNLTVYLPTATYPMDYSYNIFVQRIDELENLLSFGPEITPGYILLQSVNAFLDLEIFPNLTIGGIIKVAIAAPLVIWVLRLFAGG